MLLKQAWNAKQAQSYCTKSTFVNKVQVTGGRCYHSKNAHVSPHSYASPWRTRLHASVEQYPGIDREDLQTTASSLWFLPFMCPVLLAASAMAYSGAGHGLPGALEAVICALVPMYLHVVLPIMDTMLRCRRPATVTALPAAHFSSSSFAPRAAPVMYILIWIVVAMFAYHAIATSAIRPGLLLGLVYSIGLTGSVGNAAAHELVHSKNKVHLAVAWLNLVWCWFWPYCRAHMHHHLHVNTPEDPSSTPAGTSWYEFHFKYIPGNYGKAWALEAAECARAGHGVLSVHNRMLWGVAAQVAITAGVYLCLGPAAALAHVVAGLVSINNLSIIDYIQHYGLTRQKQANGRYEPVTQHSSWNSHYPCENALLFNVLIHSDHHLAASRPYLALRPDDGDPVFPRPALLLALCTFVPPLFAGIMDEPAKRANVAHQALIRGTEPI